MIELQPEQQKKKTIYRPTSEKGIRGIWDWSEKVQNYVPRKSGNRFQANIEKNGRSYSESFGSIHDAVKWRTRLKLDLDRMPDVEQINLKELFDKFILQRQGYLRISTIESYMNLTKHFGYLWELNVEDVNSKTIDDWLRVVKSEGYRKTVKMRTVRFSYLHEVDLLRLVFNFYKEYFNEKFEIPVRERHRKDSILNRSEYEQRKAKEKIKFISPDGIERVLSTFKSSVEKKEDRRIFYVACLLQLRTGLRIGEVFSLSWQDINWNSGLVEINKTVQWMRTKDRPSSIGEVPKNGRNRTVMFLPEVLEELKKLRSSQARITGLIFSEDGKAIPSYSSVQHCYQRVMKHAGISHKSTHIMRHSFATHFMEATQNPIALKGILGHANLKMTDKYAKVTDKTMFEGMDEFNQAISKTKT